MPVTEARTVPYNVSARWDGTDYYGAGLLALHKLARSKRPAYSLVYCESHGVNCFFVRDDVLGFDMYGDGKTSKASVDYKALWKPINFYGRGAMAHPRDPHQRPWEWV